MAAEPPLAAARLRPGTAGGHHRCARVDPPVRVASRSEGHPPRGGSLGTRRAARLALVAAAACPSPAEAHLMTEHVIGLLLGTEEDWPAAFEALVRRLGPVAGHELRTERIVNE